VNIKPVGGNIYYRFLPVEGKVGAIYLDEKHEQRTRKAEILGLGPEVKNKELKVGTKILISAFTGASLWLCIDIPEGTLKSDAWQDGDSHRLCRESEILAIFED